MMRADTSLPPDRQGRDLLREADRGTLATIQRPDRPLAGGPYASLALIALDHAAQPIFLISTLADHTQNILADDRVSLLIDGTAGLAEPLTGPRLSLIGTAARAEDDEARQRYLARHPSAAMYAGFKDFAFYRMRVHSAHLVAGFGRIAWIDGDKLRGAPTPPALVAREADIVGHMNDDHAAAVESYAGALLGRAPGPWRLTGIDAEGCDLRCAGDVARLPFATPVGDADSARAELVRLAQRARQSAA